MITQKQNLGRLTGVVLTCLLAAAPVFGATLELTGPAGATVSLNDRPLGAFPLDGPLDIPPGRYVVKCQQAGHLPYENMVRLATIHDWQRITIRLVPLSRRTAWTSNLVLAGLGQHYLGSHLRGYLYSAAEVGGLLAALAGELQRSNLKSDYLEIVELYNAAINAEEVVQLSEKAESKYSDMEAMEDLRNIGLIVAGSAIVISAVDAFISFPAVAAGGGSVPVATSQLDTPWSDSDTDNSLHAGLRLTF